MTWKDWILIILALIIFCLAYMLWTDSDHDSKRAEAIGIAIPHLYETEIRPGGEATIEAIVNKTLPISNRTRVIEIITEEIVSDFDNCYWEPNLCWPEEGSKVTKYRSIDPLNRYFTNKQGNLRVKSGPYKNDPYWIAYYMTGGCGELATLFKEVATRAGLNVTVVTASGPDEDHTWNEIAIGGEVFYIDLNRYWLERTGRETRTGTWFNTTGHFHCYWPKYTYMTRAETGENVTRRYLPGDICMQ